MLDCCDPVMCPSCEKALKNKKRRVPYLQISVYDYHGTGADIANCPECGKGYEVTFMVDTVTHCKDWDRDFEAEERERQQSVADHIKSLEEKIKELKAL